MGVISFVSIFVEIPRFKLFGYFHGAPKEVRLIAPVEPAGPSQRIPTADAATAKVDYPAANAAQPVSRFVGLTEKNLTIDSATTIVDRQSASNIFSSQQTPILTSISLAEPNKSFPVLDAQQIPTFTSSSLTEPNKSLSGLFDAQQIPTFISSTSKSLSDFLEAQHQTPAATLILPDVNKPGFLDAQQFPILTSSTSLTEPNKSSGLLGAQQQTLTLASFSLTAAQPAASGLLGVQQFPSFNSLTGSPDGHVILPTINPVVLTMPGSSCRDLGAIPSSAIQ